MPRTSSSNSQRQWLLGGAALVVATGVGFGIAKLTTPKPTPTEAAAEAPAAAHDADTLTMGPERIQASGVGFETVVAGGLA